MSDITIGEISTFLAFILVLVSSILSLGKYLKKGLKIALKDEFEPVNQKIDKIDEKLIQNTINQDKNFLTRSFDDLDKGIELNETTKERIYECMQEYTELGGNSYIHNRFEKLKKEGKL